MAITEADWFAAVLAVIGIGAAAARSRLRAGMGVELFVAAVSLAVLVLAVRWRAPAPPGPLLLLRIGAALALIWTVCAWVARHPPVDSNADRRPDDGPDSTAGGRSSAGESGAGRAAARAAAAASPARAGQPAGAAWRAFLTGALLNGLVGSAVAIGLCALAVAGRVLDPGGETGLADRFGSLPPQGVLDLATLLAAWAFWRIVHRDPLQPPAGLLLCAVLAAWISLMLPGGFIGGASDELLPRRGRLPDWWTWTFTLLIGWSAVVVAGVWLREWRYRSRRASAWPADLDRLLEPYPDWPAYDRLLAVLAAGVLLLGVYHLVRPAAMAVPVRLANLAAAVAAASACLYASHRRWNSNLAGLGLALLTIGSVSLCSIPVPLDSGGEYAAQFPIRVNAAIFGLVVMTFIYLWLPGVWMQQLMDGQAWTTSGRLIPHMRRAGFLLAALGVLIGFNMALWPLNRIAYVPDNGWGRWLAGLAGLLLLARVTARFARQPLAVPLASLSVAAVIGALTFAFVRWPPSDLRGAILQYIGLLLAVATLPVLAVAEALTSKRAAAFAAPLWTLALLFMPAASLLFSRGRPQEGWTVPLTLTVLAATYAIAAARERRRVLFVLTAALFVVAIALLVKNYRALAWAW